MMDNRRVLGGTSSAQLAAPTMTESDLQQTLCQLGEAVYVIDLETDALHWGGGSLSFLPTEGTLPRTGAALRSLMDSRDCHERDSFTLAARPGHSLQSDIRFLGATDRWFEETLHYTEGDHSRRLLGCLRDISERKFREMLLRQRADRDHLTGRLNRARFRDLLEAELADMSRASSSYESALVLVGVDNLRGINDAYGFEVADQVIAGVASRLSGLLREMDSIGRVAGGKFGALLSRCRASSVPLIADRIRDEIRRFVIETPAGPVATTVSIGVALLPEHGQTADEAIAAAEEALSAAKARGCDEFMIFRASDQRQSSRQRNMSMAETIVAALADNRIELVYQPIVRADSSQRVVFHECLIRMRNPEGGLVSAADFMPVAEKLGLVRLLDRRVLELAFRALHDNPNKRLSINLSPQSIRDPAWLQAFLNLAEGNRKAVERLIIEMTESAAILDVEAVARFVDQIREMGCSFALDDFGAGYTSFRYFKDLRLDIVKIDGSFIKGIDANRDNQIFVRSLMAIARNFDMMTVAEFVNTDGEVEVLRDIGIDCFQGYRFGKPEPKLREDDYPAIRAAS